MFVFFFLIVKFIDITVRILIGIYIYTLQLLSRSLPNIGRKTTTKGKSSSQMCQMLVRVMEHISLSIFGLKNRKLNSLFITF